MSERSWAYFFVILIKVALVVPAIYIVARFSSLWIVVAIFLFLWSNNIDVPEEYR